MNFELFKSKIDTIINDKKDVSRMWEEYCHNGQNNLDDKWTIYKYLDKHSMLGHAKYQYSINVGNRAIDFDDIGRWDKNESFSPVDLYDALTDGKGFDEDEVKKAILEQYWDVSNITYDW